MELNLEIAAIITFVITNIVAVFFIKTRSSSIIVTSLSILLLIGVNALIFANDASFLKISVALIAFLVVAQHLFTPDLSCEDNIFQKTRSQRGLVIFLPIIFVILFCAVIYLGSPRVNHIASHNNVLGKTDEILVKGQSNLLLRRSVKVRKVRKTIKDSVIMNNLTFIVLLSTFLPLSLLSIENTKPKNV